MRLYVETNFILELAFLREEHEACEELLALSEEKRIELFLPVFSVGKTYEAWARRSRQRTELHTRLRLEILDLSRSKPYQQRATGYTSSSLGTPKILPARTSAAVSLTGVVGFSPASGMPWVFLSAVCD